MALSTNLSAIRSIAELKQISLETRQEAGQDPRTLDEILTIKATAKIMVVETVDANMEEARMQTRVQMEATAKPKVERMETTGRTTSSQALKLQGDPTSK